MRIPLTEQARAATAQENEKIHFRRIPTERAVKGFWATDPQTDTLRCMAQKNQKSARKALPSRNAPICKNEI